MAESAGRREQRRADTTVTLIREARALAAEAGMAGFTIDQVCMKAGISRRTFFNYFASKDDAVLGLPLNRSDSPAATAFLAGGSDSPGLSATLVEDLATLGEARWHSLNLDPGSAIELIRAIQDEPRLLGRMLDLNQENERLDTRLIEQREGLKEGDIRARVAAQVISALVRSAASEYLNSTESESFAEILARNVSAAREFLAPRDASADRA